MQRTAILLVLSSLLSIHASPTSAQEAAYTESGHDSMIGLNDALSFQTDLFTGRFTYRLPIRVPPARQGAVPDIAIAYSSSGSDGVCGFGWSLQAGGFIQRDTRKGVPVAWQGNTPLAQYDDTKGFVLNFKGATTRLQPVGAGYRAEGDSTWMSLTFDGLSWTLTERNGNRFFFGEGASERASHPGFPAALGSSTFQWMLSRAQDTQGNEMTFEYGMNGDRLYLTRILYNANVNLPVIGATGRVDFVYEDRARDDAVGLGQLENRISYQSGYRVETKRRLKRIETFFANVLRRRYTLDYSTSASTLRSRLASFTESAPSGASMPPITFTYQDDTQSFTPSTWGPLRATNDDTSTHWNSVRGRFGSSTNSATHVDLRDFDGDGLPDRIMRLGSTPFDEFLVQFNNGTGFENWLSSKPIFDLGATAEWGSLSYVGTNNTSLHGKKPTRVTLLDIDSDGHPDRLWGSQAAPYDYWRYQLNYGNNFDPTPRPIYGIDNQGVGTGDEGWNALIADTTAFEAKVLTMVDIDADGLLDRVARSRPTPFDHFEVQLQDPASIGSFLPPRRWQGVQIPGQPLTEDNWHSIETLSNNNDLALALRDINGDGLPDRICRQPVSPYDSFYVQFNNGYGFEPAVEWGPLMSQGHTDPAWNAITGVDNGDTHVDMLDINGDGLPDRVMRKDLSPYTYLVVQLNNGSGFDPDVTQYAITSQQQTNNIHWSSVRASDSSGEVIVDMADINGDGLVDRVMRKLASPLTSYFAVELSSGPFPDLLSGIDNGVGGHVAVTYQASTRPEFDNRNATWLDNPWSESTVGLLPFPVQTVASVTLDDGLGLTGTTTYAYKNGFYDCVEREFHGFRRAEATAPSGLKTITHFYQGGGIDSQVEGEWFDHDAKVGIPFRTVSMGSNGQVYSETFNRAQTVSVGSWNYAVIDLTVTRTFEGTGTGRSTAIASLFDSTSSGNLLQQTVYGEVGAFSPFSYSFPDLGQDKTTTTYTYAVFSTTNPDILDRPEMVTTVDQGGAPVSKTHFTYDSQTGARMSKGFWLDTTDEFLYELYGYDTHGNRTSYQDPTGLETTTVFETAYGSFPTSSTTLSMTTFVEIDPYSGRMVETTNQAGLRTRYEHDEFERLTDVLESTTSFGPATLLRKHYEYTLGPPLLGVPGSSVRSLSNDPGDPQEGFEAIVYFDGMGRAIQSRTEAENGQYRVTDTQYDAMGQIVLETSPYFRTGLDYTATPAGQIGTLTEYDPLGRARRIVSTTAPGDSGSPLGERTVQIGEPGNPWASVSTDAQGNAVRQRFDAFGRVVTLIEERGSEPDITTTFEHDALGNQTRIIHPNLAETVQVFDSLRRRISVTDPDMGIWSYEYDPMGRPKRTTDAKGQRNDFDYDAYGRLQHKDLYDAQGTFVRSETYTYDTSSDSGYTVFPDQLHRIDDSVGWVKNGYDFRGRLLKTSRHVAVENRTYTTLYAYDAADRVTTMTYPLSTMGITYGYDNAGHIATVTRNDSPGTVYYQADGYDALNRLTAVSYGNGADTTYEYYPLSLRMKRMTTAQGSTMLQDLSYTYDAASNVLSVTDDVYTGDACGTLTAEYDNLYRLKTLQRPTGPQKTYSYNDIGNILTNSEAGGGTYQYHPTKVHAVTSDANGNLFTYDANGNQITRGGIPLSYDEENQLVQYGTGSTAVTFGYADDGMRVYRQSGGSTTVWIGDHFETRSSGFKPYKYCNVVVEGRRICTVEFSPVKQIGQPQLVLYSHPDHLQSSNLHTDSTGTVYEHYEYQAYGSERYELSPTGFDPSQRFTGQVLDESTGLYWFKSRYYDPSSGRFVQPDPMVPSGANSTALNRYCYAYNNPLTYVDPSGHFIFAPVLLAIAKGAVIGAIEGGIAAELQGGDFLEGAKGGALTGALTGGGIGLGLDPALASAVATSTSQLIQGESFGNALIAGGVGYAFNGRISNAPVSTGNSVGSLVLNAIGEVLPQAFEGAITGGWTAALQGRDLAEGIKSGAAGGAAGAAAHMILLGVRIQPPISDALVSTAWYSIAAGAPNKDPILDGKSMPKNVTVRRYGVGVNLLSLFGGLSDWIAFGEELAFSEVNIATLQGWTGALTLAHEYGHVQQYRTLGSVKFDAEYFKWLLQGRPGAYGFSIDKGARLERSYFSEPQKAIFRQVGCNFHGAK